MFGCGVDRSQRIDMPLCRVYRLRGGEDGTFEAAKVPKTAGEGAGEFLRPVRPVPGTTSGGELGGAYGAAVGHPRPLPVSCNNHRLTGGTRNAPVAAAGPQETRNT